MRYAFLVERFKQHRQGIFLGVPIQRQSHKRITRRKLFEFFKNQENFQYLTSKILIVATGSLVRLLKSTTT